MSNVGFIGLGIMGAPMALNLQKGGHHLFLHSRHGVKDRALLDGGGKECGSPAEVAQAAEFIITMVPDTPDVESVLFGDNGVATTLTAGSHEGHGSDADGPPQKLVIDMSSISPLATKRFAARIRELGADYIDAPVSGGDVGARNATLTIMAGCSEAAFARAQPLFELMGKNITRVGENGDGQTAKVANQIIVALTIEAVCEALVFASKAGADPAKVRQALMGGFASSRILEVHGERLLKRNFQPGFRIELHQKDLGLALANAKELGMALPNTATCQQLFNACAAHGLSKSDHSALVHAIELLADHEIGAGTT
ncbi:MAG: 2-hydroxy-3-oxopropionate reductase [Verrucomicrobia bacterium]|nr:2-hydroxy-3-oxopropionate reductase [Verrucomicrobiota bacterium]